MNFTFRALVYRFIGKLLQFFSLGDDWVKVFGFEPDTYPEITMARAMAEFNGWLYVGTEHLNGLQIWRSFNGADWQQCVGAQAQAPAGFGNASNTRAQHMAILEGNLYVGTSEGVWITQDGVSWKQVVGADITKQDVYALASFGNHVYAACGKAIWRGKGSAGWEIVVGDHPSAKAKAGFGDPDITDITSLAVFNGKLYAGAGLDNPLGTTGIAVWRTTEGAIWELFQKIAGVSPGSLHVHAMATFGGHLYVGGYHVLLVYRTDGTSGSPGSWVDVTDGVQTGGGNDGAWSLGTYRGKLYLGATGVQNGMILWETSDGKTWSPTDTKAVGGDRYCADALAEFQGYLYMTTYRTYPGPQYPDEHKLEVWRYGPRWGLPMRWFKPLIAKEPISRFPPGSPV